MGRSWIRTPYPFLIAALFWLRPGWVEAQSGAGGVPPAFDQSLYQALEYRSIGPSRGGRAPTVAGVPGQLFTFYMGTSGGVIGSEQKPTEGDHARFDDLKVELDAYLEELQNVLDDDLKAFNDLQAKEIVTPVILPAR